MFQFNMANPPAASRAQAVNREKNELYNVRHKRESIELEIAAVQQQQQSIIDKLPPKPLPISEQVGRCSFCQYIRSFESLQFLFFV